MRILLLPVVMALLVALLATPAFAVGQPNAECPDPATVPGFNTQGFGNAEQHYAGSDKNPNMGNPQHAVSQYDIACFGGPNR
jgi:hypothetical protein